MSTRSSCYTYKGWRRRRVRWALLATPPAILAGLAAQSKGRENGFYRIRLTLVHDGSRRIGVAPLAEEKHDWQVVLSDGRLEAEDYLLRHKTTVRSRYDRALAGLPEGVLDVIFSTREARCVRPHAAVFSLNEAKSCRLRLHSADCCQSSCVRIYLSRGRAVERVLTRDDLMCAPKLYVANALRGLMPVRLIT